MTYAFFKKKACARFGDILRVMVMSVVSLVQASLTVACDDEDKAEVHNATLYDIVEFVAQDGTGTVFALWRPDAVKPVTLTTSSPVINTSVVELGESVFLAYTPLAGEAYKPGVIEVSAYGTVNNSPLMKSPTEKLDGWDSEPIYLMSLWRAGNKVCMRLRMTYDMAPRMFSLVVDEATIGDEYPTAYLYHKRPADVPNFSRQYYAAFDVTSMWNTPGCKGLRIRVSNSNIPSLDTFVVENPTPSEAPAE